MRDLTVTGVQTCALPISPEASTATPTAIVDRQLPLGLPVAADTLRSEERRGGRGEISVGAGSLKKKKRNERFDCDWSSDVCSSDLPGGVDGDSNCNRRPPTTTRIAGRC